MVQLRNQATLREVDPLGKDSHEPGAKLDKGKLNLSRALREFPLALHVVGMIGDYGAKKYSEGGWITVPDGQNRYGAAMLRHYVAEHREYMDLDMKLPHAGAVAWNALARLELILKRGSRDE